MTAYKALCAKEGGAVLQFDVGGRCYTDSIYMETFRKLIQAPLCFPTAMCGSGQPDEFYAVLPPFLSFETCSMTTYAEWEGQGCFNETFGLNNDRNDYGLEGTSPMNEVYKFFIEISTETCTDTTNGEVCTTDYRKRNATDFEAMCAASRGRAFRHDVTLQCTRPGATMTKTLLSQPRCMDRVAALTIPWTKPTTCPTTST
jgi:hypothetical protein